MNEGQEIALYNRIFWRYVPFLFLCYVVAFLDRVNVGFAKLQMAESLGFSDAVYGFGAGIFFIGYFIFEVPSNLLLEKVGAKWWIARIMVTWGIISSCMMFVETEFWFYTLRFLLGVAEAGFFPGVILYLSYWFPQAQRSRMTALFMTAIAISNVVGGPVSGAIMQFLDGVHGWEGWQWLFLLEGIPSVLIGILVFAVLDDGPRKARWMTSEERALVLRHLAEDETAKAGASPRHHLREVFRDPRVWSLSLIYLCIVVGFYAVGFWMPTLIAEFGVERHDYFRVGLLTMIPWGTAAVVMVLVGTHSDRTGERYWHVIFPMLAGALGLMGLAMGALSGLPAMICLTLAAAGTLTAISSFWSLPGAFLSGTAAAAGIAWINSIGNLGGYAGPELIGRVRTATQSAEAAFWVLVAAILLGVVCLLLMWHKAMVGARAGD